MSKVQAMFIYDNETGCFVYQLKEFFTKSFSFQSANISRYLRTVQRWAPLGGPEVD